MKVGGNFEAVDLARLSTGKNFRVLSKKWVNVCAQIRSEKVKADRLIAIQTEIVTC